MSTTARDTRSSGFLDSYFQISQRGSTLARELRGGLATFFAALHLSVHLAALSGRRLPRDA